MVTTDALERAEAPAREYARETRRGSGTDSWMLTTGVVVTASVVLALVDPRLRHWFLIPVSVCGVLIGVDAARWLLRRRETFDPQALMGLFGLHFFYLAPVLHVTLDYWARHLVPLADWRHGLGVMAVVNTVGLCLYRIVLVGRGKPVRARPATRLDRQLFFKIGMLAVTIGLSAFCVEVVSFGGVSGFLRVMTQDRSNLVGLGWLLIVAESFPLLMFALVIVRWRRFLAARPAVVFALLAGLVVMQFAVAGLRGTRSATIWPVLLGLIMVHLIVRQVPRRTMVACALVFGVFMYMYGIYKDAGVEVLDVARGTRNVQELSAETGRDLPNLILGDLGRADIQALLLQRQREGRAPLGYGVSYLGDVSFLLPRSMVPDRPKDKVALGTNMLYGSGAYESGLRSTRIHGAAGEAILNFGAIGAVLSFLALGFVVRLGRRYYTQAMRGSDLAAKLLAPALCVGGLLICSSDLDNVTLWALKQVLPVALVVWAVRRRDGSGTRTRTKGAPYPWAGAYPATAGGVGRREP